LYFYFFMIYSKDKLEKAAEEMRKETGGEVM
jgi:hypothetical protein